MKQVKIATQNVTWVTATATNLLRDFRTSNSGLTHVEAKARLRRDGANMVETRQKRSWLIDFATRFANPLVLLLLAAAALSIASGEGSSFTIIVAMVMLSVSLDFIQEHQATRAAERLKRMIVAKVTVLRDGQPCDIPAAQLVKGDVILLSAGSVVPADCRLLESHTLYVNQALLTGESYPVEKVSIAIPVDNQDPLHATHAIFQGSTVISGTARALVCITGTATMLGAIAGSLSTPTPMSAFEVGTRRFGFMIMRMTLFLTLFVLLINSVAHRPLLESFLFALALAVGLTPELLPMVTSVTLARGAIRMARERVIVKHLPAIHDLGSMDVLCTDKTGTLTEAHITLERHVDADGRDSARTLLLAYLNSRFETGLKSPMDEAVLAHQQIDTSAWQKIDEAPFDFERRRVSVLIDNGHERLLIVKGAPEEILRLSKTYEASAGEVCELGNDARAAIQQRFEALSQEGLRVLGVGWRERARTVQHAHIDDESALVFTGFVAFLDPPKIEAAATIAAMAVDGVAVKIVTGDNEAITRQLCARIGLPVAGVINGNELAGMSDDALIARVEQVNLFCRMVPTQKSRIIAALRHRGHVVGYLGDGINDAPSLHAADIGISVDGAVDVAREAADLILLRHDLHVLHRAVIEGRRTFGNIMKYTMMATSSNFGNMFSMAGAVLFLPFLPMLPIQILLNNLLYDLSEIAIPLDRVDAEELRKPQRWNMDFIRRFMLTLGPVSSAFDFLTFFVLLHILEAGEALFHTGWFIESLATQVLVIFVIRTRRNPFTSRPNRWLIVTALTMLVAGIAIPYLPIGQYFGFVPPPPGFLLLISALAVAYLLCAEAAKRWFYRRIERHPIA